MATKAHNDYTVDRLAIKAGIPKAMNALHQLFQLMEMRKAATNTDSLNSVVYYNLTNALNEFKQIVVKELRGDIEEL